MASQLSAVHGKTTVRIEIAPTLPIDPLKIHTMADYDLTLCLYRTWFEYDSSRRALPGIISEWKFDEKSGGYFFQISPLAKWSDGTPITSDQLLDNLLRAIQINSTYGEAISSIVKIDRARIVSSRNFFLPTQTGIPSESFFQRMGSIFLAPTHPQDWNRSRVLVANSIVSGPYVLNELKNDGFALEQNTKDFLAPQSRPKRIEIRRIAHTDLGAFIEGKSWATVTQTASLMPLSLAERLKKQKLSVWSRGLDRVSVLVPSSHAKEVDIRRLLIRKFGEAWSTYNLTELPLNSVKAKSLQPDGYPLHSALRYQVDREIDQTKRRIRIVTRDIPQGHFQRPIIDNVFKTLGISVTWVLVSSFGEAVAAQKADPSIDFSLLSFGVADPEPATWMGLVVSTGSPFAQILKSDVEDYGRIAKLASTSDQVTGFRNLIREIGERGGYVPLFHFSTLSLALPQISFENIRELDETVDYAKLLVR